MVFYNLSRNTRGQCIVGEVLLLSEESIEKIFLNEQRRVIVDDKTQMKVSAGLCGGAGGRALDRKERKKIGNKKKKKKGSRNSETLTFLCFSTNSTNSCQQQQQQQQIL
jgi:hypothetical protein